MSVGTNGPQLQSASADAMPEQSDRRGLNRIIMMPVDQSRSMSSCHGHLPVIYVVLSRSLKRILKNQEYKHHPYGLLCTIYSTCLD
jgi:hypothetical protein